MIDMNDHFPFDRSSVSQFCLDIFDEGLCDKSTELKFRVENFILHVAYNML